MYIYEIINLETNQKYIGETTRVVPLRWNEHLSSLKRNQHGNQYLQNAWNKYGEHNFVCNVVEKCISLEELSDKETKYVAENINGYNLRGGGLNAWVHHPTSRKKISDARRGKPNGQKGSKRRPLTFDEKLQESIARRPMGYSNIVDSNGVEYEIRILKDFCRTHELWFSGIKSLFDTPPMYHYLGWRIATKDTIGVKFSESGYSKKLNISKGRRPNGFPHLMTPEGKQLEITGTLVEFCKEHMLNCGNVSDLINGKKTIYKGWTVYIPLEN